jgi:hypothetical protein
MRGPAVTMEMACRRDHSELCVELKNMKIFEGQGQSKNMVLKMKKLLNIGVGLMLWQKGGMKQCEWNEHQI